jgi:hypothetical protein
MKKKRKIVQLSNFAQDLNLETLILVNIFCWNLWQVGYENALNNIRWSPQSRDDIQLTAYRENDVMGINPDGDNLKNGVRLGGEECCFGGFLCYAKCVISASK